MDHWFRRTRPELDVHAEWLREMPPLSALRAANLSFNRSRCRLTKGRLLSVMRTDLTHEEATMWMAAVLGAFILGGSIGMLVLALLMFAAREG